MRDIKFRAWHKGQNKMYPAEEMGRDELTIATDGRGFVNVSEDGPQFSEYITDMIPLQYTGLKDKNGVEIYEDDIIEFRIYPNERLRVAIIKWYKYGYTIENHTGQFVETTTNTHILFLNSETNIEVVGNVHVNPNLLEPHT